MPFEKKRMRCGKTFAVRFRSAASGWQQKRVKILEQDVRKKNRPAVDILAAQNFSFWIFKTRKEVIEYFKIARANLQKEGIMIMDMMGGGECTQLQPNQP